jgi:uncharacterized membrane protein
MFVLGAARTIRHLTVIVGIVLGLIALIATLSLIESIVSISRKGLPNDN